MTNSPPPGAPSPGEVPSHIPVLLAEVLAALAPKPGEVIVDGTFGAGGYSRAILDTAPCRVLAFDRDPRAIRDGAALVVAAAGRLTLIPETFGAMAGSLRARLGADATVDGVVLDIGVSSMQLDEAARGFSFQEDGPLDMRMSAPLGAGGPGIPAGPSAADFLNTAEEPEIADVIYAYGEEHKSRAIARAIVRRRAERPFARTLELAQCVAGAVGGRKGDPRHPATRTFQALRIHVNDELGELARGLAAAEKILKPGGRLVVVTFHSLEDRIVKRFLAERSGRAAGVSRHLPQSIELREPSFRILNQRPLTPGKDEIAANPRARSAKLRAAARTGAPAWPPDAGRPGLLEPAIRGG
jgi:16S rRNA (cytosine1402-N4)-methyltransferase